MKNYEVVVAVTYQERKEIKADNAYEAETIVKREIENILKLSDKNITKLEVSAVKI